MMYCKGHVNKAYTEEEYNTVRKHQCAGSYQCAKDGKIRLYCFGILYSKNYQCPLDNGQPNGRKRT